MEELSDISEFGMFGISQLVAVFEILGDEELGLTLTAANALLVLCGLTMFPKQPRLPNVSDMASALGMTPSGTSRVMSNLVSSGFVEVDREIRGPRNGVFYLTEKGRKLMERVLVEGHLLQREQAHLELHNVKTFAQAKFVDRNKSQEATYAGCDGIDNRLYMQPTGEKLEEAMTRWWGGEFAALLDFQKIGDKVSLKFPDRSHLVHFCFRWVGYNRRRKNDEGV